MTSVSAIRQKETNLHHLNSTERSPRIILWHPMTSHDAMTIKNITCKKAVKKLIQPLLRHDLTLCSIASNKSNGIVFFHPPLATPSPLGVAEPSRPVEAIPPSCHEVDAHGAHPNPRSHQAIDLEGNGSMGCPAVQGAELSSS